MKYRHRGYVMAAAIAAAVLSGVLPAQDARLTRLSGVKVTGDVSIIRGSDGGWVISPWISVQRDGSPITGLAVTLEGHRLRETMPGQYAGIRITDIEPAPGGTLQFSISSRHLALPGPLPAKKVAVEGTAVIGALARIVQPASGSSFTAAAIGPALAVAWSGGSAPFDLGVTRPSGGAAMEIFSQTGLPGTSFSLPAALFAPGSAYSIVVMYRMKPFVLKTKGHDKSLPLDKSSAVLLRSSVISTFTVN